MDFILEYYFDFSLMGDNFDAVLDGFFVTLKLSVDLRRPLARLGPGALGAAPAPRQGDRPRSAG